MKLRPYQWEAVKSIWNYYTAGKTGNPIIAMPTGSGKSIIIGAFIRSIYDFFPNQRIMVLTHVKELIEQNFNKLLQIWPEAPAGIYSSGLKRRDTFDNIIFAGIASIVKRANEFNHIDLILIDEAHLVSHKQSTMYQKFIGDLTTINPNLKVIGLTATPYRLGYGHLIGDDGLFTDVCFDNTVLDKFNELVEEGYLSLLIPKRTKLQLNTDNVAKRGGEFVATELQAAVDKYEITKAAIQESIELGIDRQSWLVFTSGVEHAVHTTEMLNQFGITARAVFSNNKKYKMTNEQRDNNINEFKSGRIRALVNNNVLTTGFDYPNIDMIIVLRPTTSPGLWVQMLGRGTRPVYSPGFDLSDKVGRTTAIAVGPKPNCLVLDFGGNTRRLGPINNPEIPRRATKGKAVAKGLQLNKSKVCEAIDKTTNKTCNTENDLRNKFCFVCGNEFFIKSNIKAEAGTDELIASNIKTKEFKVTLITYQTHHKQNRPDCMKVTYYCGLTKFESFVLFEHSYSRGLIAKARDWWKERSPDIPVPKTVVEALEHVDKLKVATSIRVWLNKPGKYPEILAYCFDGTHFGKEKPTNTKYPEIKVS